MPLELTPRVGNVADASRISCIPIDTLNRLRLQAPAEGPPHYYVGRRVYYPLTGPNSLETWIEQMAADPRRGKRA